MILDYLVRILYCSLNHKCGTIVQGIGKHLCHSKWYHTLWAFWKAKKTPQTQTSAMIYLPFTTHWTRLRKCCWGQVLRLRSTTSQSHLRPKLSGFEVTRNHTCTSSPPFTSWTTEVLIFIHGLQIAAGSSTLCISSSIRLIRIESY